MAEAAVPNHERYYCNHCEEKVSKTLYFTHKQLYYDHTTEEWIKRDDEENQSGVADFTFSDSDNGMCSTIIIIAKLYHMV